MLSYVALLVKSVRKCSYCQLKFLQAYLMLVKQKLQLVFFFIALPLVDVICILFSYGDNDIFKEKTCNTIVSHNLSAATNLPSSTISSSYPDFVCTSCDLWKTNKNCLKFQLYSWSWNQVYSFGYIIWQTGTFAK